MMEPQEVGVCIDRLNPVLLAMRFNGDIDYDSAPVIRKRCTAEVGTSRQDLILNLSRVSFIDSSGLGVLIQLAMLVRKLGGTCYLVADELYGRKLARLIHSDQFFRIVASEDQVPRPA